MFNLKSRVVTSLAVRRLESESFQEHSSQVWVWVLT